MSRTLRRTVDHHRRTATRGIAKWLAVITFATGQVGCASLARHWQQDTVVSARQIALRGTDAMELGQLERANRLFAQAVEVCPDDERVRAHYAEGLWRQGDRQKAIENMRQALELSGGASELRIRLGRMQLAVGNLDQAASLARQTIGTGRQLAAAYRLNGDVLAARSQWRDALAQYHRALAIHEDYPEVQYAVGQLYLEQGQVQRALSTFQSMEQHYSKREEPANLLYMEGLAYKSLGRFDPALDCLVQASAKGMNTADLYYHLADAHFRAGDPTNARLAVQRALALQPNHTPALQLAQQIDPSTRISTRPPQPDSGQPW